MTCPHCGRALAAESNFCSACGRPVYTVANPVAQARIVRPRYPRLIAGVCSGFALHYGWDLMLTRIAFAIVAALTFPLLIILYVVLWIMLPDAAFALPPMQGAPQQTPQR